MKCDECGADDALYGLGEWLCKSCAMKGAPEALPDAEQVQGCAWCATGDDVEICVLETGAAPLFSVACLTCGAASGQHEDPDDAVREWNAERPRPAGARVN